MAESSLKLKAYAKINLGLRILGKRADGYHEIETVLQSIDLADELLLEPRGDGIVLEVEPDLGISLEDNLAHRAAQLILKRTGRREGLHIRLLKRIPAAAGLGGASSDAAAVLAGINELFHLNLEKEELKMLGLELGSDVPFFFEGGLCRAQGRGEILTRLPSPFSNSIIVLLKPPCMLRTADIYAEFDIHSPNVEAVGEIKREEFEYEIDFANDLEAAAWKLCPELKEYRAFLERWRTQAQQRNEAPFFGMSGSGPTYYALLTTEPRQFVQEAQGRLRCEIFVCGPTAVGHEITRDEL